MKNLYVISLLLSFAMLSCGRSETSGGKSWSVKIDSTSAHQRAWVLCDNGAPAEEYIAMQLKAVEDLREGRSNDDPVEVLAQMGQFYNMVGDYRKGIAYLQEAETYLDEHPEYEQGEGAIQLYGDLGDLYRLLGMIPEAKGAFRKAFALSNRLGGRLLSDLYCFAAPLYEAAEEPDSTLYCYDMALKAIDEGKNRVDSRKLREAVLCQRADFIISSGLWPDSIASCVRTLESLNHEDAWLPAVKKSALGNAYTNTGRVKEGIALMKKSLDEIRESGDVDWEMLALRPLMKAYAKNGMADRLLEEFPRYAELGDTILNREKLIALTGADLRYRTSRIKAENEMLEIKMSMMRQRVVYGLVITLLALLCIVTFFVMKRRNYHRIIEEKNRTHKHTY